MKNNYSSHACSSDSCKSPSCFQLACDIDTDSESEHGEADDEAEMLKCINTFAHSVQVGQKLSQKQRGAIKQRGPAPLTRQQIKDIVHKISTGELQLPDLPEMQDKDLVTVWALLDAGSAVNVVDFDKQFPGIQVRESTAQRKGVK